MNIIVSIVYQIDQSGKIEDTSKDTVLCISNHQWFSLVIKAKTKRELQKLFRKNGQIRNYVLFTFCSGLSILIRSLNERITDVEIDVEYYGKDVLIKRILFQMFSTAKELPDIRFSYIGKSSRAHHLAIGVLNRRRKPTIIIKKKQILDEIRKTDAGKRLRDA